MTDTQAYTEFKDEDENQNHSNPTYQEEVNIKKNTELQQISKEKDQQINENAKQETTQNLDTEAQNSQELQAQQFQKFIEAISQVIGPEEGLKLQKMLEQISPEEMQGIGGMMSGMNEKETEQQLQLLNGMNAEQVLQTFQEFAKMSPQEQEAMQAQMENMDELDLIAIKAFTEIEQEMEYYGKPWRYLNEYCFYGFSIHTFTMSYSMFIFFVYTYIQQIILVNVTGQCQQVLAGGLLPYSVLEKQEYFRLLTHSFVYNSYTHIMIALTNAWYIYFMIERPLQNWKKFAFLLFLAQVGSALNSINFDQDEFIIGNSGQINVCTILLFFFCYKYKEQLVTNKFFLVMMFFYFGWFIYYLTFYNPEKLFFHIGSFIIGILIQPFILHMPWKLTDFQKQIYKLLLVLYFIVQTVLMLYIPFTMGPKTQEILKSCPQYKH